MRRDSQTSVWLTATLMCADRDRSRAFRSLVPLTDRAHRAVHSSDGDRCCCGGVPAHRGVLASPAATG
jgi:hypothetical protein